MYNVPGVNYGLIRLRIRTLYLIPHLRGISEKCFVLFSDNETVQCSLYTVRKKLQIPLYVTIGARL
jgi:hypothetical protein